MRPFDRPPVHLGKGLSGALIATDVLSFAKMSAGKSYGDSSIAAVKSTDQRCPDDSSLPFHLPRSWAVLREPQMRSGSPAA